MGVSHGTQQAERGRTTLVHIRRRVHVWTGEGTGGSFSSTQWSSCHPSLYLNHEVAHCVFRSKNKIVPLVLLKSASFPPNGACLQEAVIHQCMQKYSQALRLLLLLLLLDVIYVHVCNLESQKGSPTLSRRCQSNAAVQTVLPLQLFTISPLDCKT